MYKTDDIEEFIEVYTKYYKSAKKTEFVVEPRKIWEDYLDKEVAMFIAKIDGEKLGAVFCYINKDKKSICVSYAIGVKFKKWYKIIRVIEQWASSVGLEEVLTVLRKGWLRYLTEYRPLQYICKKRL